jgi:hypothetical protein
MPSEKQSRDEKVAEVFRGYVSKTYELDDEVVDNLCALVLQALQEVPLPAGRKARATATGKARKPRRMSAYNVFVREMMKDEEISTLNHRDKMGAIAARWKKLGDDEKTPFQEMAEEQNNANAAAQEEVQE